MASVDTEIVSGLVIAAASAGAGGIYQNYRRRSRPWIASRSLARGAWEASGRLTLPREIVHAMANSQMAEHLSETTTLGRVYSNHRALDSFLGGASDLIEVLDAASHDLSGASDDLAIARAILPPLRRRLFDEFIGASLLADALKPTPPASTTTKIDLLEAPDGSCYYIGFQGDPVPFGERLDQNPIVKARLEPFVRSVEALDASALAATLGDLNTLIRRELDVARHVVPELRRILQENAKWTVQIDVANYGETAMIIKPYGEIEVRKRARFASIRDSGIVIAARLEEIERVTSRGSESVSGRPIESGLVLAPNSMKTLSWVSTMPQPRIPHGGELLGRFNDGESAVRVRMHVISSGIGARRRVKSPRLAFDEGSEDSATEVFPAQSLSPG